MALGILEKNLLPYDRTMTLRNKGELATGQLRTYGKAD